MRASQTRRVLGLVALVGLGALLIHRGFGQNAGSVLQVGLAVGGVAALFCAQVMWRGTASAVELTAQGLRDADGTLIVQIADITTVDRGVFAFKPSNGFTVRLRQTRTTAWRLGLWWRMGRRIGVGGMTPAHHAKFMAEQLAGLINKDGPQG